MRRMTFLLGDFLVFVLLYWESMGLVYLPTPQPVRVESGGLQGSAIKHVILVVTVARWG